MNKKTPNLADLTLKKNHGLSLQSPQTVLLPDTSPSQRDKRKGQTLRLSEGAWKQLKHLAVDKERPTHDLLLEAVNDLFQKYGKAPIA